MQTCDTPVHQDFANFDPLTARPQGILHGLAAADDAHATEAFGKVHTHILGACGCDDCFLCEGQKA